MKQQFGLLALAIVFGAGFLGVVQADKSGGYIQGRVTLSSSIKNWDKMIVLVCFEANPMCDKPAAVFKAKPLFATARTAVFVSPRLEAGKYTVFAINDKNDNAAHDPDTEEIGGYLVEGTFDPILIEPTKLGVDFKMFGF